MESTSFQIKKELSKSIHPVPSFEVTNIKIQSNRKPPLQKPMKKKTKSTLKKLITINRNKQSLVYFFSHFDFHLQLVSFSIYK